MVVAAATVVEHKARSEADGGEAQQPTAGNRREAAGVIQNL